MKHYLYLIIGLLNTSVFFAQTLAIFDEDTQSPVIGAAVYNQDLSVSVFTDFKGKVSLAYFGESDVITIQHILHETVQLPKSELGSELYLKSNAQALEAIVISASKFEQNRRDVPQKIIAIKSSDIALTNPQTSADLLESTGQVFVQKSQYGGGSPMIRGFATNRLFLSVDGVRMNNAIFRSGNIQNIISIDPFAIQQTEIIAGPGSVIYGSDAIGGVMNFYTKKPKLSTTENLEFNGQAVVRYSSASNEKAIHAEASLGAKQWGYLSSVSYTDFDDLKMGSHGPEDYLRPDYVVTVDGVDEIQQNENPRIQRFSGYNQLNLMQKVHYRAQERLHFDLGMHYTTTSDYPRYDRLILYENNRPVSAQWYYGPQEWFMTNLQVTSFGSSSSLFDNMKLTIAHQDFKESRHDRKYQGTRLRSRYENVQAFSANLDLELPISEKIKLNYGLEYIRNLVHSNGSQKDIETNEISPISSRYPDGSTWTSMAGYVNITFKYSPQFTVKSGLRYNYVINKIDFTDNNVYYNFPFTEATNNSAALTGTLGFSYSPVEQFQLKANLATAFRAPNIDDMGKVFDSEPGSVIVPNPFLVPEYSYGAEIGVIWKPKPNLLIDFSAYSTYLDNALTREDFALNGESQIYYDGELSDVQAIQNLAMTWVNGIEAGVKYDFTDKMELRSTFSLMKGKESESDGKKYAARHAPPPFGKTQLNWKGDRLSWELYAVYNGEISADDLNPTEGEKPYLYALDDNGNPYSPAWHTFNLRTHYKVNEDLGLTATIENFTNQRYRTYSSGIAAPGINAVFSIQYML